MIEVTEKALSPEAVIDLVKSNGSGCVVTYVGLIRDNSNGRPVLSVEYDDSTEKAGAILEEIAAEARRKWKMQNVAISHRIGKLKVSEINIVIAVASAHRSEGFAACQYIIDRFKQRLPTSKIETYRDGSVNTEEAL